MRPMTIYMTGWFSEVFYLTLPPKLPPGPSCLLSVNKVISVTNPELKLALWNSPWHGTPRAMKPSRRALSPSRDVCSRTFPGSGPPWERMLGMHTKLEVNGTAVIHWEEQAAPNTTLRNMTSLYWIAYSDAGTYSRHTEQKRPHLL